MVLLLVSGKFSQEKAREIKMLIFSLMSEWE